MASSDHKKIRDLEDFAGIASDWFWETDKNHCFTYFSSRMQEVTKIPPRDLIGKPRNLIQGRDLSKEQWDAHLDDLDNHRPFRNFEYMLIRPTDGSRLWVRVAGQPLFDEDGDFIGYRGTGHDVTDQLEAMSRLEAFNAQLTERNRQLDDATAALERSAFQDALTGLSNRRAFERDLQNALHKARGDIGLLHIDLDRFKWVNDTMGHPAGDAVLVETAKRIRKAVADNGLAYRVGGDEFLVIMNDDICREVTLWTADQIVEAMGAPVQFGQQRPTVGVSIGAAFSEAGDMTVRQLINYADTALYEAKRSGRNGVCQITEAMQLRMNDHRRLMAEIPIALERGEFVPFFQPQLNFSSGEVVGVEVLVRWHHPQRGLLGPRVFIAAATELGMLSRIDKLMLEEAMSAVARLNRKGLSLPGVSVNISEGRLLDPHLFDDVEQSWTDRECKLSFELLETIYFDDTYSNDQLTEKIERLRDMGVSIESDDFGSGRASITALLKIWPDRLKIDKNLVQAVVNDPAKRAVVSAILEMARALGIDSIAEGVETQADIDAMQALGCMTFQGYAVSPPLCEAELTEFLSNQSTVASGQTKTAGQRGLPKTA